MKTFCNLTLSLALILTSISVSAQKSDSLKIQQKLDSLIMMQKQLTAMQRDIYEATVYVDPLKNKKFGIEINPTSLFAGNFTGGLQLFSIDRKAEISIPVSYYKPIVLFSWGNVGERQDYDLSIDLQYRRFIGEHQNGFWFGGGLRLTLANEYVYSSNSYYDNNGYYQFSDNSRYEKNNYFGLMAGIGYRYYTQSGFYWGVSLSGGKYLNVESVENNYNSFGDNSSQPIRSEYFFDMEFLKVGFAF